MSKAIKNTEPWALLAASAVIAEGFPVGQERRWAAARLCGEKTPCRTSLCRQCARAMDGDHPDLVEMDASESKAQLERTRDLRASALTRPLLSERRVFTVSHAEMLSEPSQNALLKILEEPPPYARFLLFTARAEALLPTVRSRCLLLRAPEKAPETAEERTEADNQSALFLKALATGQELDVCRVVMGWTRMSRVEFAPLLERLYETLAGTLANGAPDADRLYRLTDILRELLEEQERNIAVSAACAKILSAEPHHQC